MHRNVVRLDAIQLPLPDVSHLSCCSMAALLHDGGVAPADAAGGGGGSGGGGAFPACVSSPLHLVSGAGGGHPSLHGWAQPPQVVPIHQQQLNGLALQPLPLAQGGWRAPRGGLGWGGAGEGAGTGVVLQPRAPPSLPVPLTQQQQQQQQQGLGWAGPGGRSASCQEGAWEVQGLPQLPVAPAQAGSGPDGEPPREHDRPPHALSLSRISEHFSAGASSMRSSIARHTGAHASSYELQAREGSHPSHASGASQACQQLGSRPEALGPGGLPLGALDAHPHW